MYLVKALLIRPVLKTLEVATSDWPENFCLFLFFNRWEKRFYRGAFLSSYGGVVGNKSCRINVVQSRFSNIDLMSFLESYRIKSYDAQRKICAARVVQLVDSKRYKGNVHFHVSNARLESIGCFCML